MSPIRTKLGVRVELDLGRKNIQVIFLSDDFWIRCNIRNVERYIVMKGDNLCYAHALSSLHEHEDFRQK